MESREPSVVVASEIEMASGTPEPQSYAHAELPSVLVSNTQLTEAAPSPVAGPPEAPPFIVLPHAAQAAPSMARARTRLALLGACACVSAGIVVALLVGHLRSPAESPGAGPLTASAPDSVGLRPAVHGDRTGASADETQPPMVAVAESGTRHSGAIAPMSIGNAGARDGSSAASAVPGPIAVPETTSVRSYEATSVHSSPPREPSMVPERANPDAPTASAAIASVSPLPSPTAPRKPPLPAPSNARPASTSRTSDQATADEAAGARLTTSARRPAQTPPNPADSSPPSSRALTTRAAADAVSEVTLVIRVKGFAAVSIDGDEPSASPRRKRVQAGTHHVVMTGYPDGADEKKTKEFDVNVPAGREETIIHKSW